MPAWRPQKPASTGGSSLLQGAVPWIDLRTGYRCNNHCRFCDQGDRRTTHGDASFDVVVAALSSARAEGADAVWLAGGEITLRPDLPRVVRAARTLGYGRVGVQTNGRIFAAAGAAAGLRAAGLTDAIVALHAATPALHDWLVGEAPKVGQASDAAGPWRETVTGARQLVRAGVATRINTVLTRSGVSEIAAIAALVARLGVEGHRWILARETPGMVPPRLATLREPLVAAILAAWEQRREVETVGVPLCILGPARAAAADRRDAQAARRVFTLGDEPTPEAAYGPACAACTLRAACPGVDASYAARFGTDELVPPETSAATPDVSHVSTATHGSSGGADLPAAGGALQATGAPAPRAGRPVLTRREDLGSAASADLVRGAPVPVERVFLHVGAPCPLSCPCAARDAHGAAWPLEPERSLRRRLVRAASEGASTVVFAGASPWAHPGLPAVIREARRLGFQGVEVWGPIEPLDGLDAAAADKMVGLTKIRAPRLAVAPQRFAEASVRLAALMPGCVVEIYTPTERPAVVLFQAVGASAVWGSCQSPER
jgi:hypothetical protein